jgi:pantothenate kinase type III
VIDRAIHEARRLLGRTPLVLLTGGGARTLRPLIRSRHVYVPDLTLRGLAVLASSAAKVP